MARGSLVLVNQNKSEIYSISSIFWSALLPLIPPTLYFAAEWQSGVVEMLLVAAFFMSIAALFFLRFGIRKKLPFSRCCGGFLNHSQFLDVGIGCTFMGYWPCAAESVIYSKPRSC